MLGVLASIGFVENRLLPFEPGHEGLPFIHDVSVVEEGVGIRTGCLGLAGQMHICLFRRPTGFAMIARDASGNDVNPDMRAVSGSWKDMVDGQVLALNTAVLTGEPIAMEDRAPGQLTLHDGLFDHVVEADDRWDGVRLPDCVNVSLSVCEQFSLTHSNENHGPLHVADVERLIVLIEYQHRGVENHHQRLVDLLPQDVHRRLEVGGDEPERVSRQYIRHLYEDGHNCGLDHRRFEVILNVFYLRLQLAAATF